LSLLFFSVGSSAQSKADLELEFNLPSESARGGESFSYTVKVRNTGSETATDVALVNDPKIGLNSSPEYQPKEVVTLVW
jgi:hypothetical protein